MANFASGFTEGLVGGLALQKRFYERQDEKAEKRAMEILAEADSWNPEEFNPAAQGVPTEGQPAATQPRGNPGTDLAELNKQYFDAIGQLGLEAYAKGKEAWGVMRQSKVNEYGLAAVNAANRGDTVGAEKMLRLATTYVSPGYSSEVRRDPKSGAFLVATYDKDGNPSHGMALTTENILDIVNMNNDPQAWADSEHTQDYQDKQVDIAYKRAASEIQDRNARLDLARTQDQRAALQAQAELANANLDTVLKGLQITDAERATLEAGSEARKAAAQKLLTYNKTQADAYKAEHASDVFTYTTDPILFNGRGGVRESSGENDWDARNDVEGAGGRGHFGRAQFSRARYAEAQAAGVVDPGLSIEEFATAAHAEDQKNVEAWHWYDLDKQIIAAGLDKYLGQQDARGTPITWWGLRFAAHSGGMGGAEDWVKRGVAQQDVNTKGPADYMELGAKAGPIGPGINPPPEGAVPEPGTTDYAGALIGDNGEPKEDVMATNPWWFEPPNANGEVYERKNIWEGMGVMTADMEKNNPTATREQIASLGVDAFGDKPMGKVIMGEGDEPDYYTDGVSKLIISPEISRMVDAFTTANADLRAQFEERNNPKPYETFTEGGQQPQQEQAIPAPEGPMAGAPAPGAAAAAAPAAAAPAIPEPAAATAAPPPTVDPTAVRTAPAPARTPPAAGKDPTAVPPTVASVPQLAQAVQQWIQAGRPPDGVGALGDLLMSLQQQLPPDTFFAVQQELIDFVHGGFTRVTPGGGAAAAPNPMMDR